MSCAIFPSSALAPPIPLTVLLTVSRLVERVLLASTELPLLVLCCARDSESILSSIRLASSSTNTSMVVFTVLFALPPPAATLDTDSNSTVTLPSGSGQVFSFTVVLTVPFNPSMSALTSVVMVAESGVQSTDT